MTSEEYLLIIYLIIYLFRSLFKFLFSPDFFSFALRIRTDVHIIFSRLFHGKIF